MSIMRLTGPCISCHVGQQPTHRHRATAGPSRGHPSALNGPLDSAGYREARRCFRGGQPRGDPILFVWASGDCVLTSVNPLHIQGSREIGGDLTTVASRGDTSV